MRIKLLRAGSVEVVDDATIMLVEDENGTPVSLAYELGVAGAFTVACCIDDAAKFNEELRKMGLDITVVKVDASKFLKPTNQLPAI